MNFLLNQKKQALFCPAGGEWSSNRVKKSIRQIMRISALLVFLIGISTFNLLADTGKAQELSKINISITVKNEALSSVLHRIESLTALHFVYPSTKINSQKVSSFKAVNLSIARTLDLLLTPLHLNYKQIGDNILIDAVKKNESDHVMSAIIKIEGKVTDEDAAKVHTGSIETANKRTINKYIHLEGIKSCQLVMGLTILHGGSVWNTMPAHVHDRRMEAYFYFDVPEGQRVFHYMGEGQETRHVLMDNYDAIVSPPWSIHSGSGTASYSFIWGMAGENLDYTDMDAIAIPDIR